MTAHDIKCFATDYAQGGGDLLSIRNANREMRRDETYLNWRYSMRPAHSKPIIVFAENDTREKIGCLSLIPHEYVVDGKPCSIGVLGDISVDKAWRGRGVTGAMLDHLMQQDAIHGLAGEIVLPNESAERPLRRTGWQPVSKLERYVKLVDVRERFQRNHKTHWWLNTALGWINQLLRLTSLETYLQEPSGFHGEAVSGFDERFDRLWNRLEKKGMIIGCRNREYLTWRYSKHPVVTYQIYTVTCQKELYGYIIFHITDRHCSIDDILCLDQTSCARYCLASFLNFIRKNSMAFSIDIKTNHNDLLHVPLALFGFIKRPGHLTLMVSGNGAADRPAAFTNGAKWYLTSSDKDV